MINVTAEDIREMRRDGSFAEFIKHQGAMRHHLVAVPEQPKPARPSGHRPGAWPTGTRPPTAAAPVASPEAWQQAVHDYRAWMAAGQPPGDFTCECGCTPADRQRRAAS